MKKIDLIKICKNLEIVGDGGKLKFPLHYKITKNKVEFWYETKSGRFEPQPITFSRFIPLNQITLKVFGLIQAEATKVNYTVFDFSNSNPDLIKIIVNYFEKLWLIPRRLWKCEITYWKGKINKELEKGIKSFWSSLLKISPNQIKIREGTSYRLSKKSKSKYGVVSLRLPNKVFRSTIIHVLKNYIYPSVEKNSNLAGYYLCGLLSGDGTIVLNGNSISYIGLAFNPNSDELNHYKKVLNILNITPNLSSINHVERKNIQITGWKNFYQILKVTNCEPFISVEKNIKFYKGFLNNQYVKSLLRLEEILKLNEISAQSYSKLFRVCERSAHDSLTRMFNLNILSRMKRGQKYVYFINPEGKEFLKIMKCLRNKLEVK